MNGRVIRLLTAGESHGPALTAILDGVPAGLDVDVARDIVPRLARRQKRRGASARQGIEQDVPEISAGLIKGQTTGAPLSFRIDNRDHAKWRTPTAAMTVPRPGHADLVGAVKFGFDDLRPSLERASARETAVRVAAGAVCTTFLAALGIRVGAFVQSIGPVSAPLPATHDDDAWHADFDRSVGAETSMADAAADAAAIDHIRDAGRAGDTLGGVITGFCTGLPVGLGSFMHADRKLDARLGSALFALPAVKGLSIGAGFSLAAQRGTEIKDAIYTAPDGALLRRSNHSGGLEAGVTNGAPVWVQVAFKPISTTRAAGESVDLSTGSARNIEYERSDVCHLPRACPIVESAMGLVLLDALLEKVGGDSLSEVRARMSTLRRAHLDDLKLSGAPLEMYPAALLAADDA